MIFVTVGHQMPFDRLIAAMDRYSAESGCSEIVAQVGDGARMPSNLRAVPRMSPKEFRRHMADASAIVAHAGMGTIITAVQMGKPLLVLPRLAVLGETRSDHQVATARTFAEAGYLLAATDESDLLRQLPALASFRPRAIFGSAASPELLDRLRTFVWNRRSSVAPVARVTRPDAPARAA